MSTVENAYKLLGISHDASLPTIRRAYKERSLQLHPDKHPEGAPRQRAEQAFKELSAAYALISDEQLRAQHADAMQSASHPSPPKEDPFRNEEFQRTFASNFSQKFKEEGMDVDPDTLFDSLFGERRANFRFTRADSDDAHHDYSGYAPEEPVPSKGPDREIDLPLTLEELHTGCTKKRRLHRVAKNAATGVYSRVAVMLRIDIKPGYRPGDKVRFRNAGDEAKDRLPPDVVFVISQKPHHKFTRDGDDIVLTVPITLVDALTGTEVSVEGIDGKNITVKLDHVVKPSSTRKVPNEGLSKRFPDSRGNLILKFDVLFPNKLMPNEKTLIRDVFSRIASKDAFPSMRRSASLFMNRSSDSNSTSSDHPHRKHQSQRSNLNQPQHADSSSSKIASNQKNLKRTASLTKTDLPDAPPPQENSGKAKARANFRFATFFR